MSNLKLYLLSIMKGERKALDARIVGAILSLCAVLYGVIVRCVSFFYKAGIFPSKKVPPKVISVGNITLGGTGKTPFTIMLAERIKQMGKKTAVLIRGYGEDESHLLAARLGGIPVLVGADRYKSAKRAVNEFQSNSIILDDGFQHRRLKRDLNIVLVDTTSPFGNMRLFPAGILREPLERLKDADLCVLTKADMKPKNKPAIYEALKKIKSDIVIAESLYKPSGLKKLSGDVIPTAYIKGKRVALLAAIANPEYFEWMLKNLGAEIGRTFYYVDHHIYTNKDLDSVIEKCAREGINIVITTEKDIMRSNANGQQGLPDLIRKRAEAERVEFFSLMIDCTVTKNEEGVIARLRSLFNS